MYGSVNVNKHKINSASNYKHGCVTCLFYKFKNPFSLTRAYIHRDLLQFDWTILAIEHPVISQIYMHESEHADGGFLTAKAKGMGWCIILIHTEDTTISTVL